jgi:hypothetical protein
MTFFTWVRMRERIAMLFARCFTLWRARFWADLMFAKFLNLRCGRGPGDAPGPLRKAAYDGHAPVPCQRRAPGGRGPRGTPGKPGLHASM